MKITNTLLIIIVGGLFIFSGLIKLNDPMGTEIKLEEYFSVFSEDKTELGLSALKGFWEFLSPFSLHIAVFLSVLEVVLGVSLLLYYRPSSTLWTLLFTIIFFTFLTFYSAYFDKVKDCGCFGDAIKLTPWQSFYKDLILLAMIVWLFFQRGKLELNRPIKFAGAITTVVSLASFVLALYAIWHLPPLDFLPYKIGANIPANMKESAPLQYGKEVYTYTNKQTGKDEEFSTEEYGKVWKTKLSDTTQYVFKKYDKPLLNPEALPKITDYNVTDQDGNDVTQSTFEGDKLLVIIPDARKTDLRAVSLIKNLVKDPGNSKIKTMILTGSDYETFEAFRHEFQLSIPYYFADLKVLKTMIRSNPGLMLLRDGIVLNKWHANDIPAKGSLHE
ncbi:MAG: DoxX family protein [Microscillaceae bacterium]|nr:DoxX family protein [Microscillaceae bacterium]